MLHRLTGIALVGGSVLLVAWLALLAAGPEFYATFDTIAHNCFGQVVLFFFTLIFWYHFVNGIRHLFWDAGLGFNIQFARKTGVAMLLVAALLTLATWVIV